MEPTANNTANDFTTGLQQAWYSTAQFLPKLVAFLAILIIGYFVAVALAKVLDRVLEKLGFNRAVERSGIKRAMAGSGYQPSDILSKVLFYAIFLFVLELAFGVFGPNPISELLNRVIAFLPNIFVAIVIVVIAASIAAGVRDIVRGSLGGLAYGRILADIAAAAVLVVGAFAALNQLYIAPEIVNGLFYAILAIVVGVTVVAVGGAGIQPLRSRWETALSRLDQEVPRIQREAQVSQSVTNPAPVSRPNDGYVS